MEGVALVAHVGVVRDGRPLVLPFDAGDLAENFDAEILPGRIRLTCSVDQIPAELVGRPLDEVVP